MPAPAVARPPVSESEEWLTLPLPPQDGFTADDLDRIPDLPPHTELIDGNLVLVSPQKRFHARMLRLLEYHMLSQAPEEIEVEREMTVVLGERQRPEPDLMLIRSEASVDMQATSVLVEDVLLAIEVVSPESRTRDRERKPQLYAQAGIAHFWLVEEGDDGAVVYVYELDPVNGGYTNVAVHRKRLQVDAPCPFDIDLAPLDARPNRQA